nr:N-terminal kinase-like protein [Ipomoea batatas]
MEPLEDPKPPAALANIQAAQKRPVSQPKSQASIPRPKSAQRINRTSGT